MEVSHSKAHSIPSQPQKSSPPLHMYIDAPTEEISLEEFEAFGLDRLTGTSKMKWLFALWSEFSVCCSPKTHRKNQGTWQRRKKGNSQGNGYWLLERRERQAVAFHSPNCFLLKVCFKKPVRLLLPYVSPSEESRRWFLQQEVQLFRFRWDSLSGPDKAQFFSTLNIKFERVRNFARSLFFFAFSLVFCEVKLGFLGWSRWTTFTWSWNSRVYDERSKFSCRWRCNHL